MRITKQAKHSHRLLMGDRIVFSHFDRRMASLAHAGWLSYACMHARGVYFFSFPRKHFSLFVINWYTNWKRNWCEKPYVVMQWLWKIIMHIYAWGQTKKPHRYVGLASMEDKLLIEYDCGRHTSWFWNNHKKKTVIFKIDLINLILK